MIYPTGTIDFCVYREDGEDSREAIPGICSVDLPDVTPEEPARTTSLRLHFMSVNEAAEAMARSGMQKFAVFVADGYFDAITREDVIRQIKYELWVKPYRLVPGSVSCGSGCGGICLDKSNEGHDETVASRRVSGITNPNSICEYRVCRYAAYCDGRRLWEADYRAGQISIGEGNVPAMQP